MAITSVVLTWRPVVALDKQGGRTGRGNGQLLIPSPSCHCSLMVDRSGTVPVASFQKVQQLGSSWIHFLPLVRMSGKAYTNLWLIASTILLPTSGKLNVPAHLSASQMVYNLLCFMMDFFLKWWADRNHSTSSPSSWQERSFLMCLNPLRNA